MSQHLWHGSCNAVSSRLPDACPCLELLDLLARHDVKGLVRREEAHADAVQVLDSELDLLAQILLVRLKL